MDLYAFVKIIYIHKYFFSEVGLGRRLRWILCTVYPYNITVTVYIVHNYNNNNNYYYCNIQCIYSCTTYIVSLLNKQKTRHNLYLL